ncbi:DUF998 domain-containing protein [Microbacterium yannicii]|uniref:DUF998 domain-containing protein n=1 Tax=Microbacterium yannicii TaxID=671622 RepID=UPI0002FDCD31|nr:DUF998 domain-containing protein [Microbacterium yannicii]
MTSAVPSADGAASTARAETSATYIGYVLGALGAIYGLILGLIAPDEMFAEGPSSFSLWAATGAGCAAAAAAGVGFIRSRDLPGQEWRRSLAAWTFAVNTLSVVLVHAVLAFIVVYVIYRLVGLGFIGLPVHLMWSVVMMAVTAGVTGQQTYRSVSRMSTQRLSSLVRTFIAFGVITAMAISPESDWWKVHFSHLGTFHDLSSLFFNGTLVVGGLLVSTFAVYIAHDMRALVQAGVLATARSPRVVSTLFVVMGIAFAGVGLCSVDVNRVIHDIAALGLAATFLTLLIASPKLLRGMPPAYFMSTWVILAATIAAAGMFALGVITLTAIEIIVFVLIFAWIAVFTRFLGVAGRP